VEEKPALDGQMATPGERLVEPPVPVELPVVSSEKPVTEALSSEREKPAGSVAEAASKASAEPEAAEVEVAPEPIVAEQAKEKTTKSDESVTASKGEERAVSAAPDPKPEPAKKSPEPAVAATKTVSVAKPGSEAWLLRQNPSAFTLQLIGVQDEAGVSRFLERYKLPGQTAYFRTSRQGKPWFPVLYGVFPNRDAAVAAKDRLPESLKRSGVWPRSLESVQKEIQSR
jgi:DamX protein